MKAATGPSGTSQQHQLPAMPAVLASPSRAAGLAACLALPGLDQVVEFLYDREQLHSETCGDGNVNSILK